MSRLGYVAEVLKEFGSEIGMGELALDETDRLSLVFDGVLVTLVYTEEPIELIWIYIDLGEVPADSIKVPQHLLKLGFECWAQNVMTIGLDDAGRNAVGYSSMPVTLFECKVLKEMLTRLLEATFIIKEELSKVAFDEQQEQDTSPHELQLPPAGIRERV